MVLVTDMFMSGPFFKTLSYSQEDTQMLLVATKVKGLATYGLQLDGHPLQ